MSRGFGSFYTVMEHSKSHTNPHSEAHTIRTPEIDDRTPKHTAKDLTAQVNEGLSSPISDVTLRTRWFRWVRQAVGIERTKPNGKYTDLARVLFLRYRDDVVIGGMDAQAWADQVGSEFAKSVSAEVVEPVFSGGALARFESSHLATVETQVAQNEALNQRLLAIKQANELRKQQRIQAMQERQMLTEDNLALAQEIHDQLIEQDELDRIEREEEIRARIRAQALGKPPTGGIS